MTPLFRFFILALTPLLAVTVSVGPALLFGFVITLVLLGVTILGCSAKPSLQGIGLLWASVVLAAVLITLIDLGTSIWLPTVRSVWGPYLNLLAFSPLVMGFPRGDQDEPELGTELSWALLVGMAVTGLFLGVALVREALGSGSLTLVPGSLSWKIAGLNAGPLALAATGAGGFFLVAAGMMAYRLLRPWFSEPSVSETAAGQVPRPAPSARPAPAPVPKPTPKAAPRVSPPPKAPEAPPPSLEAVFEQAKPRPAAPMVETPHLESAADWGETLHSVVADLPSSNSKDRRRILIIGAGNGELAYYLAMLCLEHTRDDKLFRFRVRGVDHFLTRVEAANRGAYRDHQIEMIPAALRDRWMAKGQGEDKYLWYVSDEVKLQVQFEVADFQQGQLFFSQPAHLIVLNQGIEYVTDDKKTQLLKTVCEHLAPSGALIVTSPFKREFLPEDMKRTGTTVFRKG